MSGNDERIVFPICDCGVKDSYYCVYYNIDSPCRGFINSPEFLEKTGRTDYINPKKKVSSWEERIIEVEKLLEQTTLFKCPNCAKEFNSEGAKGQLLMNYGRKYLKELKNGGVVNVWK